MKKTYEVIVCVNGESADRAHCLLFDGDSMPDVIFELAAWLVELGEADRLDISIEPRVKRLVESP